MRFFLLPKSFNDSETITLTGKDYNYIVNALRLRKGQCLSGRDTDGKIWKLCIEEISKTSCTLSALPSSYAEETTDAMPQDRPQKNIILYQCLPKGRKADDIIKHATEIGVRAVVLVNSKNVITKLEGKEDSRLSRYDSLIKEAIQQSGSLVPTAVTGVIDIKDVADDFERRCKELGQEGLGLILHQCKVKEDQCNLVETLKNFNGTVGILVGAEGGFTDEECSMMIKNSFKPVLLKSNILRCETASLYALAAVQTLIETSC